MGTSKLPPLVLTPNHATSLLRSLGLALCLTLLIACVRGPELREAGQAREATPVIVSPPVAPQSVTVPPGALRVAGVQAAVVLGTDDRVNVDFADAGRPWLRAIGMLNNGCTGAKIDHDHVLTARHCFALENLDPAGFIFYPAYQGSRSVPPTVAHVSFSAMVHGTGRDPSGSADPYVAGSEWTVLTIDKATYAAGDSGVPSMDGYPYIQPISLPVPFPASPITIDAVGYSADWQNRNNRASAHYACSLVSESSSEPGIVHGNCDWEGGASGGPLVQIVAGEPRLAGHMGGHGRPYNRGVSAGAAVWAPYQPTGLAVASDGLLDVFSNDRDYGGQIMHRRQNASASEFRAWADFRSDGVSLPDARTLAAARLPHGRLWLFLAGTDGTVWNRWQTAPGGAWSDWTGFFPNSAQTTDISDVAVVSAGGVTIQVYLMRENGEIFTTYKSGAWNGPWKPWRELNVGQSLRSLAVADTSGYQQLFAATASNAILTTWTVDTLASDYLGWEQFADGLPAGEYVEFRAGYASDGSMDVFALIKPDPASTSNELYRRTKTSPVSGSAWGPWTAWNSSSALVQGTALAVYRESAPGAMDHVWVVASRNIFRSRVGGWRRFYGAAIP